ncbi:hypothetical protein BCR32DRAFT_288205, partial [Anaeromyces robustus]
VVIDAPKKDGDCGDKIADAELLIIKTGYTKVRAEDTKKYQYNGPYLTPEVAQYLIDNFQNFKFFDIEDMDLSVLYEKDVKVNKVVTAPLRIEGLDSSQVTIMAEIEVA